MKNRGLLLGLVIVTMLVTPVLAFETVNEGYFYLYNAGDLGIIKQGWFRFNCNNEIIQKGYFIFHNDIDNGWFKFWNLAWWGYVRLNNNVNTWYSGGFSFSNNATFRDIPESLNNNSTLLSQGYFTFKCPPKNINDILLDNIYVIIAIVAFSLAVVAGTFYGLRWERRRRQNRL